MKDDEEDPIPGEVTWRPPRPGERGEPPYDWQRDRGWPKHWFEWEEVVFIVLAIGAVVAAFCILASLT